MVLDTANKNKLPLATLEGTGSETTLIASPALHPVRTIPSFLTSENKLFLAAKLLTSSMESKS